MGTSRTIDFCPREAPNPGRLPPQASAIFVPSDNSRLYIVCNNYTSWHIPSQLYNLVKKSRIWILLGSPSAKKKTTPPWIAPKMQSPFLILLKAPCEELRIIHRGKCPSGDFNTSQIRSSGARYQIPE